MLVEDRENHCGVESLGMDLVAVCFTSMGLGYAKSASYPFIFMAQLHKRLIALRVSR